MKRLLFLLFCIPVLSQAQNNAKYLAGAVPESDGKVIFSRTIEVPQLSQEQIYNRLFTWAQQTFITDKNQKGRLLFANKEKGEIACWGEEYLVFSSSALSLDRTLINYQMVLEITPGKCDAKIYAIRYSYNVSTQNEPEKYKAEELITDKYALNKDKDKLVRKIAKFRIRTVDLFEKRFTELENALGLNAIESQPTVPPAREIARTAEAPHNATSIPASASGETLQGFRRIDPDKIPGNIIKMLSQDWMLITAGNETRPNMMTASWGGLGFLYNKPIAFCFINPARYTYQLMETGDTYTLTFYTEAYREALNYCGHHSGRDTDKVQASGLTLLSLPSGAPAFQEAWLIIECRKLLSQSLIPEAISDPKVKAEWTGKPMHKMYIGEILHVWIK